MIANGCTSATVFVLLILAVCVTLASTPIVHVHQASIHTKATASLCSQTGLKQNANDADAYWVCMITICSNIHNRTCLFDAKLASN